MDKKGKAVDGVRPIDLDESKAHVVINARLRADIQALAAVRGVTQSRLINEALLDYLNEEFVKEISQWPKRDVVSSGKKKKGAAA